VVALLGDLDRMLNGHHNAGSKEMRRR